MDVTVHLPDNLAVRLGAEGNLSRRASEALEEYKSGHIGQSDLPRLLGFTTRCELDGFLKAHEVWMDYTIEDFQHEREDLRRLGF